MSMDIGLLKNAKIKKIYVGYPLTSLLLPNIHVKWNLVRININSIIISIEDTKLK